MKKLNPLKISSEVDSRARVEFVLEYLDEFTASFSIPFMDNLYSKISRTKLITLNQIREIEKRAEHIPIKEIETPEIYICKYWTLLFQISFSLKRKLYSRNQEKELLENLFDFFVERGYLTQKQINLIKFTLPKEITKMASGYIAATDPSIIMRDFSTTLHVVCRKINSFISINYAENEFNKHPITKILLALLPIMSSYKKRKGSSPMEEKKNEESLIIKSPEKEKKPLIPKEFLSLREMRRTLMIN